MQLNELRKAADQVSNLMKLLSSPNRLLILCQLIEAEYSVGELCEQLDMKLPAMSQQLALLRREGLLGTRREGQTIFYSIVDDQLLELMEFLHKTYCTE